VAAVVAAASVRARWPRRAWFVAAVVAAAAVGVGPVVVGLVALLPVAVARAQCSSNASSCVACHEAQGLRPVLQSVQPWHVDHGFGDLCAACHGGDPSALDAARAHLGLRPPLAEPSRSCAGCHQDEAAARAERYAASAARSDAAPPASGGPGGPGAQGSAPSGAPAGADLHERAGRAADRALAALSILLAFALVGLARRGRQAEPRRVMERLRATAWSPYAAGALLGVVVAVSEVFCGRPLAASGAFDKLAAYVGQALFPSSQYYGHVMRPGVTWQVWLMVGVLGGAFASARLSGTARWRWLPDEGWTPQFGPSRALRLGLAFAGAVLVQLGAGIAGGCTSGLAISGGAVLAPAAFLFMAGMFAGGIPTAWLWARRRRGG
jgi:cytochrome c553